jgi:putative membrane protein
MRSFRTSSALSVVATSLIPRLSWAHDGRALDPHDVWRAWTFEPAVALTLAVSVCCYTIGLRAHRARAKRARGIAGWRVHSFVAGMLALGIALLSPIDAVSGALFSVHMVQHLLLVVVAAPLIVVGEPAYVMLWALPVAMRRGIARQWRQLPALRAAWHAVTLPVVAWTLHVAMLWLWHAPRLYDDALRMPWLHVVEHSAFFLTALVFWWVALDRRRLRVGASTFYLFVAALQGTLLGALLTLARHPWYLSHYGTTQPWGLSPLEDQQIAGLIMWIPAGLAYLIAVAPRLLRALSDRSVPSAYGTSGTA